MGFYGIQDIMDTMDIMNTMYIMDIGGGAPGKRFPLHPPISSESHCQSSESHYATVFLEEIMNLHNQQVSIGLMSFLNIMKL